MYVYAYECVYVHYFIYKVLSVYSSQINTFTFVSFDVLFSHMPISVYVLWEQQKARVKFLVCVHTFLATKADSECSSEWGLAIDDDDDAAFFWRLSLVHQETPVHFY